MNIENVENLNTGFLKAEYVKNVTHCFCAAVEYECKRLETNDLIKGYNTVISKLVKYSCAWCDEWNINPIEPVEDDLLKYFFNQKNAIPGYVYFWFKCFYSSQFGKIVEYKNKHMQIYNELQKIYIERYRNMKNYLKSMKRCNRSEKHRLCEMFSSGDYTYTFKLYNKPLSEFTNTDELEKITDMLLFLFGKQLCNIHTTEERIAVGYILGRMQGRADCKNIPKSGGALQQSITKAVSI